MQILIATTADIPELARVEVESKLQSFSNPEPYSIDIAARLNQWQTYFAATSPASSRPKRVIYKAVENDAIIGYIAGHLTARHGKDAEIQNFYILKPYQRQGIGSQLLLHLLVWLKQQHAQSMCVGIDQNNPYQAFYINHGGSYLNPHWIAWDDLEKLRSSLLL